MEEILNAKITGVSLSMADHGCLTFWINLEGSGWGVSVGGYAIGHGYLGADEFDACGDGLEAMMRIMDTVGVERWEDLKGKYVRVKSEGWGSTAHTIGNVLEDKWFDVDKFFKEKRNENIHRDVEKTSEVKRKTQSK